MDVIGGLLSLLKEGRELLERGRIEELEGLVPRLEEAASQLKSRPGRGDLRGLKGEVEGFIGLLEAKREEVRERARRLEGARRALRGYLPKGKPPARFLDRWSR